MILFKMAVVTQGVRMEVLALYLQGRQVYKEVEYIKQL